MSWKRPARPAPAAVPSSAAEEFFGVTIQPDKEIVLMLVPADIKDAVLTTVYKESGLSQEGQGIAFSVPVERTTTIRKD